MMPNHWLFHLENWQGSTVYYFVYLLASVRQKLETKLRGKYVDLVDLHN